MSLRFSALLLGFAIGIAPASLRAADPPASAGAAPVEVQVVTALTGPGAFAGKDIQTALNGVENYVNRTGGIRGRPLKFVYSDDQTSTTTSVQLINTLTAKGTQVVIGPTVAGSCEAVRPLLQSGPVSYCFSPGVFPPAGSFMFSSGVSNDDLLVASIRYMREREWDRIAIIASTDASGQGGEVSMDKALALPENRSIQVVAREHFNAADVSVAAQITRLKAAAPKALIVYTTGSPLATVLRGLQDSGLELPVMSSSANGSALQLRQYAAFMPAQFYIPGVPSQAVDRVSDRAQRAAIDVYLHEMKALGVEASKNQTVSWDPGMLVVSALRAVGASATAEQIRAYIANLRTWTGVLGRYDFVQAPQRGVKVDAAYIVRWDKAKGDFVGVSRSGGRL
jgi:branched-chain amino acid transport system substrate-binding protein